MKRRHAGLVKPEGSGWLLPRFAPPSWDTIVREMWGVTDPVDVRWMLERLRPTPVGHFRDPVRRVNAAAEKLQIRKSISTLIKWLADPEEGIRTSSLTSLKAMTNKNLGPDPAAWHAWWNGAKGND